jgi:hypothetical protein
VQKAILWLLSVLTSVADLFDVDLRRVREFASCPFKIRPTSAVPLWCLEALQTVCGRIRSFGGDEVGVVAGLVDWSLDNMSVLPFYFVLRRTIKTSAALAMARRLHWRGIERRAGARYTVVEILHWQLFY